MRLFLGLVVLVVACDSATAPRRFTLGPACRLARDDTITFPRDADSVVIIVRTTASVDPCPDPPPKPWRFLYWDTVWVD